VLRAARTAQRSWRATGLGARRYVDGEYGAAVTEVNRGLALLRLADRQIKTCR